MLTFEEANTLETSYAFKQKFVMSKCDSCTRSRICVLSDFRECSTEEMMEDRGVVVTECNYYEEIVLDPMDFYQPEDPNEPHDYLSMSKGW